MVVVGYPNRYRIGMSNLGFHFLYAGLRYGRGFKVERLFSETAPKTLETSTPFSNAVSALFTISYEEDLINLARILIVSGIEPLSERRSGGPVIIAGGPAVTSNPLPVSSIADAVVLGEGEGTLPRLSEAIGKFGDDRGSLIAALGEIPAVYLPGQAGGAQSAGIGSGPPVSPEDFQHSVILSRNTTFPRMLLVEVSRGCPGACSFCLATIVYRPYRPRSLASFTDLLEGLDDFPERIGLVSTSVAAHPEFTDYFRYLIERRAKIGLSSLRAEDIDEEKADLIGRAGMRSVSLAPESGIERVRRGLGKNVSDAEYFEACGLLARAGVRKFSLYFMLGAPNEDSNSLGDTRRFLAAFKEAAGGAGVTVHVNTMVPKAGTPLQYLPVRRRDELREALRKIEGICRELGMRTGAKSIRSSLRQAQLSLGDERIGRSVVEYCRGGVSWKRALLDQGVDPDSIHAERKPGERLPWDRFHPPEVLGRLISRYESLWKNRDSCGS
jgi:radical SAM superfamily enzyme YgiQ (UPF0313 family)